MKQLRYLKNAEVDKATREKQDNGVTIVSYESVGIFTVQDQELTDEISASIYGADVNRMIRISSPHYELESFLAEKVNNTADNVSLYTVVLGGFRYKIVAVKKHWVDIALI